MAPHVRNLFVHGDTPPGIPGRAGGGTVGPKRGDARSLGANPLGQGGGCLAAPDAVEQVSEALCVRRLAIRLRNAHQGLGVEALGQLAQDGRNIREVTRMLRVPNEVERGGLRAGYADLAGRGLDADSGSLRVVRLLDEPKAGGANLDGAERAVGDYLEHLGGLVRGPVQGGGREQPDGVGPTEVSHEVPDEP